MMTVERLHEIFDENVDKQMIGFEGNCHDCGCEVKVGVTLMPEGFLVTGGAVFEPDHDQFFTKCDDCFEKNPLLTQYQKCEVYSRVVGYLRPVSQWNEGKQAEFKDREVFDLVS